MMSFSELGGNLGILVYYLMLKQSHVSCSTFNCNDCFSYLKILNLDFYRILSMGFELCLAGPTAENCVDRLQVGGDM